MTKPDTRLKLLHDFLGTVKASLEHAAPAQEGEA
jgi:hypothetical protein